MRFVNQQKHTRSSRTDWPTQDISCVKNTIANIVTISDMIVLLKVDEHGRSVSFQLSVETLSRGVWGRRLEARTDTSTLLTCNSAGEAPCRAR